MTLLAACCAAGVQAKVTLPGVFTDNMVVQQQTLLTIRGKADAGKEVTLQTGWNKKAVTTQTNSEGDWTIELQTPKAGGPYTLTFSDGEELTLKNVMVGEVWLGGGQSNMEVPVGFWTNNSEEEVRNANFPNIRLLRVKKVTSMQPLDRFHLALASDGWQECSPESVREFSALAYFFACGLWNELQVPIGIIQDCWGGSKIEPWTRREVLEGVYGSIDRMAYLQSKNYDYQTLKSIYDNRKFLSEQGVEKEPPMSDDPDQQHMETALWNAMINPLVGFPLKGFIWYQGCSNCGAPDRYEANFQALIEDWRSQFGNPNMPFYFVQLANFGEVKTIHPESAFAMLREAQAAALHLPNTGMVVNIDMGLVDNVHPKTGRIFGARMAALALHNTYEKKKIPCYAPMYDSYRIEGNEVRIRFSMPEGAEPLEPMEKVEGFVVAGYDRKWHDATARIEGDEVVVTSAEVAHPLAVRYAWADNPPSDLHTRSNFRVAPFRTDHW